MPQRPSTEIQNHEGMRDFQLIQARPGNFNAPALWGLYVFDMLTGKLERSFGFDIPPQQDDLNEQAAVEAVPAQEGGFFSDERGQYFKMVTLSGTFGFRPTRKPDSEGLATVVQAAQQIQQSVANLQGRTSNRRIPKGEVTGHDRLVRLHNLLRFYWDSKMSRSTSARYLWVYANWRYGEVYVAQPLQFRRTRSAPADRLKAKYNLTQRLLIPLEVTVRPKDFLVRPDSKKGLAFVLEKMKQASRLLDSISSFVKSGLNAGFGFQQSTLSAARGLGESLVNAIFEPIDTAISLVRETLAGVRSIATFPVDVLRKAHRSCMEMVGIQDDLNRLDPRNLSTLYRNAANAIADLFVGITLHTNRATGTDVSEREGSYHERRDPNEDSPFKTSNPLEDRGTLTAPGAQRIPEGRKVMIVPERTTIQQLAREFLGSAGKWRWLKIVNNLSAPYIAPRGDGVNVLRPGDPIVLPIEQDEEDENQVWSPFPDVEDQDANRYGRDIMLDLETMDIEIINGDFGLVAGIPNLVQAVHLKLSRKPGDLIMHPWYGLSVEAGEALEVDTRAQTYFEVNQTVTADPRIERMENLRVRVGGDILRISSDILPKDSDRGIQFASQSKL